MGLDFKRFQVVDTMDVQLLFKGQDGSRKAYVTGETSQSNISVSTEKIEVQSGIGGETTFSLNSAKTVEVDCTVKSHDLELIAIKNGVDIDKTAKTSFAVGAPVALTAGEGTLEDVVRILVIRDNDETQLTVVDTEPKAGEVKVEIADGIATITCEESVENVFVTAEVSPKTGKDNWGVTFYAGAFAKNCELLMNTVMYDAESSEIVADLVYNFYNCSIDSDYSLEYGVNTPVEIPLKLKVLKAKYVPSTGKLNTEKKLGELIITER